MDLNDLKIDPEFAEKIPPLTEEEFNLLEQNILADGQVLVPLIVWRNTILDGHNRYRILKKHPEIPFKVTKKEFADNEDKYSAIAWICRNQLGRRNLTPEQKRYLVGKQYEAEKLCRGGSQSRNRDEETGQFTSMPQNEALRDGKTTRTSSRIAEENNTSRAYVERAEQYAKGIDAAEEVLPGIRNDILSGTIHPTQKDVIGVARATPEDREELVRNLRDPKPKETANHAGVSETPPWIDEDPDMDTAEIDVDDICDDDLADELDTETSTQSPPRIPKRREILAISEKMEHSEGQVLGTVEDMIYEMNSALEDMIWRWNYCKESYKGPIKSRDGKKQIKELADQAMDYLRNVKKGVLWKKEEPAEGKE